MDSNGFSLKFIDQGLQRIYTICSNTELITLGISIRRFAP